MTFELRFIDDEQSKTQVLGTTTTNADGVFEASVEVPSSIHTESVLFLFIEDEAGFSDFWILDLQPVVVDNSGDGEDSDLKDAVCDDGTGSCSLRAALEHANTFAGPVVIDLSSLALSSTTTTANSASSGAARNTKVRSTQAGNDQVSIRPESSLPFVTDGLVLEGSGTVVIDGSQAPESTDGLTIRSDSSRITGLAFTGFGRHGIMVQGSGNQVINTEITGNGGDGIHVIEGTRNRFLNNVFADNGGLPIDLGGDGTTSNDPDDADDGPNNLQNYPKLSAATSVDSLVLQIDYAVSSSTTYTAYPLTVEFFVADGDVQEGLTLIGTDILSAEEAQADKTIQLALSESISDDSQIVATATDAEGNTSEFSAHTTTVGADPASRNPDALERFALHEAYPNPSSGTVTIPFDVKQPTPVRLAVYDLLGRRVATLIDRDYAPGRHEATFDGSGLPAGIYAYRIEMGGFQAVRKMVQIR